MKYIKFAEYPVWGLLIVCFIAASLISITSIAAQEQTNKIIVTVDVFSGRPNPSFEITDANEIARLQNSMKVSGEAAGMTVEETREFDRLGYRGILLANPSGIDGIPLRMQLLKGKVRIFSDGDKAQDKFLNDVTGMEKYYLSLAKKMGLIPRDLMDNGIVPDPDAM